MLRDLLRGHKKTLTRVHHRELGEGPILEGRKYKTIIVTVMIGQLYVPDLWLSIFYSCMSFFHSSLGSCASTIIVLCHCMMHLCASFVLICIKLLWRKKIQSCVTFMLDRSLFVLWKDSYYSYSESPRKGQPLNNSA